MTLPDERASVRRVRGEDGDWRYWHSNGWVIYRETRDWDLRGLTRGASHQWQPKHWWEVKRKASNSRRRETFSTLAAAKAWCDEHTYWPEIG